MYLHVCVQVYVLTSTALVRYWYVYINICTYICVRVQNGLDVDIFICMQIHTCSTLHRLDIDIFINIHTYIYMCTSAASLRY